MAGTLIAYQGIRASSVTARRARGYGASMSVVRFPLSRFGLDFDFKTPTADEVLGDLPMVLPSLDSIRKDDGDLAHAGDPASLSFAGALLMAEAQDETWRVVLHPLFVVRLERVRHSETGAAMVQATLADERYFWSRGFMPRWSYNRTRGDGTIAADSVKDTGEPFSLAEVAHKVTDALSRSPKLAAYPAEWDEDRRQVDFQPLSPPLLALSKLAEEGGTLEPCLRLDGTVALHRSGDGMVGYAPDGEGPNKRRIPDGYVLDLQGTGSGVSIDAPYPDPHLICRGGRRIATVAIDEAVPVLGIKGRYYKLETELIRSLTGGKYGMEWLKVFVLSRPEYQGTVDLPEDVIRLFRDDAFRLYQVRDVQTWSVELAGAGDVAQAKAAQKAALIASGVSEAQAARAAEEVTDAGDPLLPVASLGPNAHLMPMLQRAEAPSGRRQPVTVERWGFRITHRDMAGGEAEAALGIPAKLAALRKLLEQIKAAGRRAQKPIDGAIVKNRGGGLTFGGGFSQDLPFSSGDFLHGLGVFDTVSDYQTTAEFMMSGLADALAKASQLERMKDVDPQNAAKYDALTQEINNARDAANGTATAQTYELAKALVEFEREAKAAARNDSDLAYLFGMAGETGQELGYGIARLLDGTAGDLEAALKKHAGFGLLLERLRDRVAEAVKAAAQAAERNKAIGAIGGSVAQAQEARTVHFVENLTPVKGEGGVALKRTIDTGAQVVSYEQGVVRCSGLAGILLAAEEGLDPADLYGGKFEPMPVRITFGATVRPRTDISKPGAAAPPEKPRPVTGSKRPPVWFGWREVSDEGAYGDLVPDALGDAETWYTRAYRRGITVSLGADGVSRQKVTTTPVELSAVPPGSGVVVPRPDLVELVPMQGAGNAEQLDKVAQQIAAEHFKQADQVRSVQYTLGRPWPVNADGVVAGVTWSSRADGGITTLIEAGSAAEYMAGQDRTRVRARPADVPDAVARELAI